MAAEALSFAAAYAVYRPESTGAWLRLHTPPKPSATHEDMGDDEEWEKRPHLDAPDPWDDSKWKEARTAAAASGVSVLVSGGAHARRVANWLRAAVRNICFVARRARARQNVVSSTRSGRSAIKDAALIGPCYGLRSNGLSRG